ncbi:HAMP domain-containing sensor histidine kinase [Sinomonas sp. ASV486]|uniref:sensor histidine kinase n=1 Tax=Sinomonas sp. ASV486 TaxID=3051170 RepID=UPI0027DDC75C|nr:HAMP domain-containing sensor histidine kinase [Sinomonas sp. ASV486]MDQ4489445.1 HAMP domain-containing sensor histidine kinase [Sinomonas sp. ASV486]
MRRRLVLVFVVLAVCIIALYGGLRAFIVADLVRSGERSHVATEAGLVAVVLGEYEGRGAVTAENLRPLLGDSNERIDYTRPDGQVVSAGMADGERDAAATHAVPGGGTVTVTRSESAVAASVQRAVGPVTGLGVALLAASVLAALILARVISAPFVRLAAAARALGEGRLELHLDRSYAISEAQSIATALEESDRELRERIRRGHEFAANASHQLRTPITALRLELEDLSLWPETPPAVAEQLGRALAEIDRLTAAIQDLLELSRGAVPGASTRVPLGPMLADAVTRWHHEASAAGRSIRTASVDEHVSVPAPSSQILDVLLHNALRHGKGQITLSAARAPGYVRVRVADEGDRPKQRSLFERSPQKPSPGGEGIGLALASELSEALGGHLVLDPGPTTSFTLMLPDAPAGDRHGGGPAATGA